MKGRVEDQRKARLLRSQGYTLKEICSEVKAGKGSVSVWVRDVVVLPEYIERYQEKKSTYRNNEQLQRGAQIWSEQCKAKRDVWRKEGRVTAQKGEPKHSMACGLYWAEGAKDRNGFSFANSDPGIMSLMVEFLNDYFGINGAKLKCLVYFYENANQTVEDIEKYWGGVIGDPNLTWMKHVINPYNKNKVPEEEKKNHLNKLPYGVCHLKVTGGTHILQHIYGAIEVYSKGKTILDPT